jgi:hypothetical protein
MMTEDFYLAAFAPFGMTRRGFRALLKALRVPSLEVGSTRFVDVFSFNLAIRSIMRIGQPTFLTPGCDSLRKAKRTLSDTTELDLDAFRKNLPHTIAELLVASRIPHGRLASKKTLNTAASAAVERMLSFIQANDLPSGRQRRRARDLTTRISEEILGPDSEPISIKQADEVARGSDPHTTRRRSEVSGAPA